MDQFQAKTSVEPRQTVVALAGECDLAVRDQLTWVLEAAVDTAKIVVVDLADLQFLDSSGVHGLVTGHHAALKKGTRLYVINAGGPVAHVLDITGVGDLLRPPPDGPGAGPA
jgi:anti-sigma B factor antagonist